MKPILLILVGFLICVSCSITSENQSIQTTKIIESTLELASPTTTSIIIPTPDVSTTPTLRTFPASPGIFLMCYIATGDTGQKDSFQMIDLVKYSGIQIDTPLIEWQSIEFAPIGLQYAYITKDLNALYIVDILNNNVTLVPDQNNCSYGHIFSWSSDISRVLLNCREDVSGLRILNISNGNLEGVVPNPDERDLLLLQGFWSPDGKWIAYTATEYKPNYNMGPYIVSTDCLQNTAECQKKVTGIRVCIGECHFWWTNDNLLAVDYTDSNPNQIGFFDPQTGALVRNEDLGGVDNLADYSWSPDGRYLVIENTRENGARMVKEIASGKVLFDLDAAGCDSFLGWLSIP